MQKIIMTILLVLANAVGLETQPGVIESLKKTNESAFEALIEAYRTDFGRPKSLHHPKTQRTPPHFVEL